MELPAAILGYIRLDRSRALNVSGDTLFFCCTFDCGFLECPEQNIDDAYGIAVDVAGKILFHPPGTKKYGLTFLDAREHYQYPNEDKNYAPDFPGVRVNQKLYPAFGANEAQRHKWLDAESERFLDQYCPEALRSVSPVPLRQIAEERWGCRFLPDISCQTAWIRSG